MKKKQYRDIVTFTTGRTPNQLRANSPRFQHLITSDSKEVMINELVNTSIFTFLGLQANVLMLLQSIYAFRIGELLNIRRENVHSNGFVYVPGSKRSNGKIIYFPDLQQMEFVRTLGPPAKIFTITYRQYYLLLSRLGIQRKMNKYSKNYSVTHLFRHLRIAANEHLASGDYETQKNFSGHRSNSGLNFYLNHARLSNNGKLEHISCHK